MRERTPVGGRGDEFATEKLVWLLDHEYSEAGLSFDTFKNADAARAQVLAAAAERAGCEIFAAILHIEEHGDATWRSQYVYSGDWYEESVEAMEIGELFDSHHRLDIDHETERRGRPYTLVCTKNRASHRRRLAEYAKDVSWMRRLIRSAPVGAQAAHCAPDLARLHEAAAASERN